ncbi:PQQ-like beta-propeller repeat protein [Nocardiopsis sp. ARC36]
MGSRIPQDSSAAVTPDGLKVVHTLPSGNGGSKELTVLNSATGRQLSKLDVPGDAFAHRQLLTSTHVLTMNDREIEAFSLESGDHSWTYQAPPECLELPNFDPENVWQWPISTHEDLVFVPQVCFGSSNQEPENISDSSSLNVVALESATGENFWDSEVIFSTEYADDTGDGSYPSRLMSSGDMQTLILRAPEGFYALDAEGGEVLSGEEPMAIEDGLFEDRLLYAGSEFFVSYDPELSDGDEIVYVKSTYGGETVEEIRVPEDIHPPVEPPWTPAPRAAALREGIVLFSCGDGNDCEEGSVPLEIYFFPWDGGEPSEVRFQGDTPELSGPYLRSSLLPVPGTVVAYQRWPAGYPVGAVVGLT